MIEPGFLRIRWDVVPGAHKFLDALRPYTVIADPVSLHQNFTGLKSLSREDQQQQLHELAARGQTITAIYAARKLYGCSLGEAKEMVGSLRGDKAPQ
jgi:ribosomal protein L7/L12